MTHLSLCNSPKIWTCNPEHMSLHTNNEHTLFYIYLWPFIAEKSFAFFIDLRVSKWSIQIKFIMYNISYEIIVSIFTGQFCCYHIGWQYKSSQLWNKVMVHERGCESFLRSYLSAFTLTPTRSKIWAMAFSNTWLQTHSYNWQKPHTKV